MGISAPENPSISSVPSTDSPSSSQPTTSTNNLSTSETLTLSDADKMSFQLLSGIFFAWLNPGGFRNGKAGWEDLFNAIDRTLTGLQPAHLILDSLKECLKAMEKMLEEGEPAEVSLQSIIQTLANILKQSKPFMFALVH
jgi:hypothetical protein